MRQSSTTYESDGTSSMFSSGPYSGLSAFDHDNISRTAVFSEDLHEGRWKCLEEQANHECVPQGFHTMIFEKFSFP